MIGRILIELEEGHRIEIVLGIENADAPAKSNDRRRPPPCRMPDGAISARERMRRVAWDRTFFDEQFAPGLQLSFTLDLTSNDDSDGIPDGFTFYVLDNSGAPLPTLAPGGGDYFLTAALGSSGAVLEATRLKLRQLGGIRFLLPLQA